MPLSEPGFRLLAAVAYLIPGLVWATLCEFSLRFVLTWRPQNRLFRLLPVLTALGALNYVFMMVVTLVPLELHRHPSSALRWMHMVGTAAQVALVAVAFHAVRLLPPRAQPPSRAWVTANYGAAGLVVLLALFPGFIPATTVDDRVTALLAIRNAYTLVLLGLIVLQTLRYVRRGGWRPGGLTDVRSTDVILLLCGALGAGGWLIVSLSRSLLSPTPAWLYVYDMVVGLGLTAPLTVRALGQVVRRVLLVLATALAVGAVHLGGRALAASIETPGLGPLLDAGTILALVLLLLPAQAPLRGAIDYLLFRRSARRREELDRFLHELSPELGVAECGRRGLAELVRVMQLRGAAMLFPGDGEPIIAGAFRVEPLRAAWPRDTPPVFPGWLAEYALREVQGDLKEALIAAEVVAIIPVTSPRRHWGHLCITTGLLGATGGDEDVAAIGAFADGLGRILDAAELLARAVGVERSLAHAEKLAAIGELAARIAHEIRNPVTAARSLAQQLAREPGAAFAAEHELILGELERVERQVAALLRFARREEFRFEPIDLAELVQATLETFQPRLAAAEVEVRFEQAAGVVTRADPEKLRQVVVNLLDNALDALADGSRTRRLVLEVARENGIGRLRVTDTGPGVPAEAFPRLFEPFFSLKPSGTGLGLAIAKRTIDAHGGRMTATSLAAGGLAFTVELPLAGGEV